MKTSPRRRMVASVAWCVALLSVAGALIAGPITLLRREKARVAALQEEIDGKAAALGSPLSASGPVARDEVALERWRNMTASEPSRLDELSSVARASGATVTALQALEKGTSTDSQVVSCPYRVGLRGRYDQLAAFCDGLYSAQGLAAIDELQIEPAESTAEPGLLQASVRIAWFAVQASAAGEREAVQQ